MRIQQYHPTTTRRKPRGFSIIVVIAFFAVAVVLIGVWVRTALDHLHQARRWHEKVQATWLADAGVRRAAARLAQDPEYAGEHWQIAAAQLGGNHAAEVTMTVEPIRAENSPENAGVDPPARVRISATAELPAGPQRHVRHSKSIDIPLVELQPH